MSATYGCFDDAGLLRLDNVLRALPNRTMAQKRLISPAAHEKITWKNSARLLSRSIGDA